MPASPLGPRSPTRFARSGERAMTGSDEGISPPTLPNPLCTFPPHTTSATSIVKTLSTLPSGEVAIATRPKADQRLIAVGTALTGAPPHRSVREVLPHTALTLGRVTISRLIGRLLVCQSVRCHAVPGAVSGASKVRSAFPSVGSLPSTDSAAATGPALFARFAGTMEPSDFPWAFMSAVPSGTLSDRSAPRSGNPQDLPVLAFGVSQACTGSSTPPCPPMACQ